jgi:hypothetical protein
VEEKGKQGRNEDTGNKRRNVRGDAVSERTKERKGKGGKTSQDGMK